MMIMKATMYFLKKELINPRTKMHLLISYHIIKLYVTMGITASDLVTFEE